MKLSEFPTPQIMIYAEMVSKQFDELFEFDVQVYHCCEYGGMTEKEKDEVRADIGKNMVELEEARVKLVKEINRRIKRDLKIKFGPSDVQPFVNRYIEKYPLIGKGEAETKAIVAQKKEAVVKDKKLKKA